MSQIDHKLYDPSVTHDDILDALAEHCGVQWGLKRPVAEAIVAHFNAQRDAFWNTALQDRVEYLEAQLDACHAAHSDPAPPENKEEHHETT